jgi:hypothetical protein
MVIAQEPAQSFTTSYRLLAADVRIPSEQQDVALPLMIPLSMVMLNIFAQRPPQGVLAKKDHLGQALLLHRPDPTLRISQKIGIFVAGRS